VNPKTVIYALVAVIAIALGALAANSYAQAATIDARVPVGHFEAVVVAFDPKTGKILGVARLDSIDYPTDAACHAVVDGPQYEHLVDALTKHDADPTATINYLLACAHISPKEQTT
jgi:Flp pilus assembly protein CpaB